MRALTKQLAPSRVSLAEGGLRISLVDESILPAIDQRHSDVGDRADCALFRERDDLFAAHRSLGMAGLWEYFRMIERSGIRCFTAFGMACGAASFIGSFFALRTNSQTAAYDFENIVLLVFLFGVFARQMFRPTGKNAPLETMAYTLFGLLYVAWLFNFMTKIIYVIPRTRRAPLLANFMCFIWSW